MKGGSEDDGSIHVCVCCTWAPCVAFVSEPMSASLVDFGLYFFHNANEVWKNEQHNCHLHCCFTAAVCSSSSCSSHVLLCLLTAHKTRICSLLLLTQAGRAQVTTQCSAGSDDAQLTFISQLCSFHLCPCPVFVLASAVIGRLRHREARLWNSVFVFAQQKMGIPNGSHK
jgi:hypothetical protein